MIRWLPSCQLYVMAGALARGLNDKMASIMPALCDGRCSG